ncbi:MAG: hypothetical protein ACXVBZ_15950 [Flavisolibacter sp.]
MKVILCLVVAFLNYQYKPDNKVATDLVVNDQSKDGDSSLLRITNTSSLKRLPSILHDLTIALKGSSFMQQGLLNENGFTIDLYDAVCRNFDTSASVTYRPGDTVYYLKLNRLNKQASDRSLAVTLIHEFMHCILIDIDKRARSGNQNALSLIEGFNQKIKNPNMSMSNNFFDLMNRGDDGEHELMYQLFYPEMVCLLERFGQIHKTAHLQHEDAELLIWSGLQNTTGFKNLDVDDKKQIQLAIMREKGIEVAIAE